jgi:Tol biopolymer transport system component
VIDLKDGTQRRLTEPAAGQSDTDPQWSPDDVWITFRRHPVGAPERTQVWLVRADGGDRARPLDLPAVDARWAP